MKSIHLFAGIGGGIIADVGAGNTVCGAVEINPFCREVLFARQRDGWLPPFPILSDVREVQGDEFGENIELVCGGFPCQDVSSCNPTGQRGLQWAKTGLFYELVRIVDRIRPKYVFLENVANVVSVCLREVLEAFAERGYDAEWACLSAADVGAWHVRPRWWGLFFIPDASGDGRKSSKSVAKQHVMASERTDVVANLCETTAGARDVFSDCISDGFGITIKRPRFWESESTIRRVVDGVPSRVDRAGVTALGNAQVPFCAYCAYELLMARATSPLVD